MVKVGQMEESSLSHLVVREFQKGTQRGRSLRRSLVIDREVLEDLGAGEIRPSMT